MTAPVTGSPACRPARSYDPASPRSAPRRVTTSHELTVQSASVTLGITESARLRSRLSSSDGGPGVVVT
jgi:hypothetical protein